MFSSCERECRRGDYSFDIVENVIIVYRGRALTAAQVTNAYPSRGCSPKRGEMEDSMAVAASPSFLSVMLKVNGFVRKHFVHLISAIAVLGFLTPGLSHAIRGPKVIYGQLDAS